MILFSKSRRYVTALFLHAKSFEVAESQAGEIEKMIEDVAAVNLTRQRQQS